MNTKVITTSLAPTEALFLGLAWTVNEMEEKPQFVIDIPSDLKYLNMISLLHLAKLIDQKEFIKAIRVDLDTLTSLRAKIEYCLIPFSN